MTIQSMLHERRPATASGPARATTFDLNIERPFSYGSVVGTSIRSPFYRLQEELGATFMEEAGWFWTESFGDARAEHRAVREDLGIWDVSPLVKWEVRGPDALIAGQRLHAGDILGL